MYCNMFDTIARIEEKKVGAKTETDTKKWKPQPVKAML